MLSPHRHPSLAHRLAGALVVRWTLLVALAPLMALGGLANASLLVHNHGEEGDGARASTSSCCSHSACTGTAEHRAMHEAGRVPDDSSPGCGHDPSQPDPHDRRGPPDAPGPLLALVATCWGPTLSAPCEACHASAGWDLCAAVAPTSFPGPRPIAMPPDPAEPDWGPVAPRARSTPQVVFPRRACERLLRTSRALII